MNGSRPLPPGTMGKFLKERLMPWIILFYTCLAALVLIAALVFAVRWSRVPYTGRLVGYSMNIRDPGNPGPGTPRQLRAVDDHPVATPREFYSLLRDDAVGEVAILSIENKAGEITREGVELSVVPRQVMIRHFFIPFGVALIYLLSAIWTALTKKVTSAGWAYISFCSSAAVLCGSVFDFQTTQSLAAAWFTALFASGVSLFILALIYPRRIAGVKLTRTMIWSGCLLGVSLLIGAILSRAENPSPWIIPGLSFLGLGGLLFTAAGITRTFQSPSPVVRHQSRAAFLGCSFSFLPLFTWWLVHPGSFPLTGEPLLFLSLLFFPFFVGYSMLRYRILKTSWISRQGLVYTLLVGIVVTAYALFVSGLSIYLGKHLPANNPFLVGGFMLVLAVILNPLLKTLRKYFSSAFFREEFSSRRALQEFNRELTRVITIEEILVLLRTYLENYLAPHPLHIFIYDQARDEYRPAPAPGGQTTTGIRFSGESSLPGLLSDQKTYLYLQEPGEWPVELREELPHLSSLDAILHIPLPGYEEKILGWLSLGPRRSGEAYTDRVIEFLEDLTDQAVLALERARAAADLEKRMREMNIFTRVARAVNMTTDFEDILELIYSQTTSLVEADFFSIALLDQEQEQWTHALYIENDTRHRKRENIPLQEETLARAVARSGQAVLTNDYPSECEARDIMPGLAGIFAWMGVPLNTDRETIGVLSLGSRDPGMVYTAPQLETLQAIANQTSGAITRARLLTESEQHARQLKLLNEVGRSITSTLDLSSLLHKILRSASEILNTEAGTLFLVDQDSQELIFEVVLGPVADALLGTRLPAGKGHVGMVVESGQPRIITDVHLTEDWAMELDRETGFQTRNLLIVPMELKGEIIGVIELINKKDGSPFFPGDQELLTSFASQAAIALENARLYTQTDRALADRVKELSTMQEIDRELNASLDVRQAMQITLLSALRQVEADAGLVGILNRDVLQIMAEKGYRGELDPYHQAGIPLSAPSLVSVFSPQNPPSLTLKDVPGEGFLKNSRTHLSLPIKRETDTIGVIFLERVTDHPWQEDSLAFLSRLSDHAAIAIANARLYAEIQEANLAKSEFISLVSHELKTPMTSIRGYSDLLLKGAAGNINQQQRGFLNTIRENVARMSKLVSDLADVSRIETGRLHLDFQPVDLTAVIDDVIQSFRGQLKQKQQALTVSLQNDLPPAWGDQTRISQIITNLVSNAHKYTPPGGKISISGVYFRNTRDLEGPEEVIHIAVQDTGLGIREEDQVQLFNKFFRTEDARAGEAPGTGLGLNITRNLVEMQNGKIWFETRYGEGSTFHFTIPTADEKRESPAF